MEPQIVVTTSVALPSLLFCSKSSIIFDKELVTDDNQFGFEDRSSSKMCTYFAVEVIN